MSDSSEANVNVIEDVINNIINEIIKNEKKRGGTQCVAYGCKKRKKSKKTVRSDSSGDSDDESASKRKVQRSFFA